MKAINKHSQRILLVDDEVLILEGCRACLSNAGWSDVIVESDSRLVLPLLEREEVDVIVLDLRMPNITGLELLPQIVKQHPEIKVIVATASNEVETVVNCMKEGAFDYMVKPIDVKRLLTSVKKALEMRSLAKELTALKNYMFTDRLDHPEAFAGIVTGNKAMRAVFQYLEVIAGTRQPVTITGETGTGKELIARAIHDLSGCSGDYVALNVAGLDDNMFSDTLFGHRKGAFTGADQARDGLITRAAGGTLFLDEIGDLNEMSQIKLLRLLQEQEYYPVGSDFVKKSDARIVLATNRNLQEMIKQGKFRNDLYYRLCGHRVHLPPLRERRDDIPLLLDHFLEKVSARLGKKKPTPPPELAVMLTLYPFPGNIREMEALVSDAVLRHTSGVLSMETFREVIGNERPASNGAAAAGQAGDENPLCGIFGHFPTIDEVEQYMINEAMKMAKGNQGLAGKILGMGRQTLNKRLKTQPSS
ncbi:sigma-54-dependent transcriptional regulator [Geomonas subterranea]|uniref:Sigma-54 dependent transcriptional regulator n=1 Tax=Geomonas subterranea TaxID=2847989 RepID=A0ABX8LJ84_9BACT|nr:MULTISPECIES: sigma-54 dependent transcriptional regulator [Geomonas]QXE92091.1 sigma-54 dependent transcriptional regulator [Geomonas subterranea]QXM09814.1 sigma-54 dependent transcriptional regulator [Geomonas subterranea]